MIVLWNRFNNNNYTLINASNEKIYTNIDNNSLNDKIFFLVNCPKKTWALLK